MTRESMVIERTAEGCVCTTETHRTHRTQVHGRVAELATVAVVVGSLVVRGKSIETGCGLLRALVDAIEAEGRAAAGRAEARV